jgi:pyruvate kinase
VINLNVTKIIATIGPASAKEDVLTKMLEKGLDIVRINLSHGSYPDHDQTFQLVKLVSEKVGKKLEILCDLQGPKIRLGKIRDGQVKLVAGQIFSLTIDDVLGDETKAAVDHKGILQDVEIGKDILINDGAIVLKVSEIKSNEILTEVVVGGIISDHKGVNLPGMQVSLPSLTEKDLRDLNYLADKNFEYLACSFVRKAEDIKEVRRALVDKAIVSKPMIVAKLETQEGVANAKEIIKETDGVMIARGDMAVEMPYEKIPIVQKVVIKMCNQQKKLVITATQMLESMVKSPVPTRAEITDVANAVIDGTNIVMLSAETAVGQYPVETIEAMERIIYRTEAALMDGKIEFSDIFC